MRTDTSLCAGCNKCISVCPVQANDAVLENGKNIIYVQSNQCVFCGACIEACERKARWNQDDSEAFLLALKMGQAFSLLVAPSVNINIPQYRRLLGYLKQQGVQFIYDVSFGADISAWGYLRALKDGKGPLIAQPCPVVVRYIEKFLPHLLPRLAPVHSPVMCTAIYMKQVVGIDTSLAFLSPCIAKKMEFEDGETGDFVQFNITFNGILRHLKEIGVDLSEMPEEDYDNPAGALGFVFPRPGGLAENLRFHLGDELWIRQVEGMSDVKQYLKQYSERLEKQKPVPQVVDLLCCKQGCNNGTATEKKLHLDDIDYEANQRKSEMDRQKAQALMRHFDETLNADAFSRGYTIRSHERPKASEAALEKAYLLLGKVTQEDRSLNCFSCGFESCYSFAKAVALGQNHKENCAQYMRQRLALQTEELREKNESVLDSLRYASKIQRNLLPDEEEMNFAFKEYYIKWIPKDIVGGDLYWLKVFYDGVLLCVGDCTGHGTPGALLTMLVVSALKTVVTEKNHNDVAEVLRVLDKQLGKALNVQNKSQEQGWKASTQINDGVDLALVFLKNKGGAELLVVGGVRALVCKDKEVQRFKGQRLHLGDGSLKEDDKIKVHSLQEDEGCRYFLVTDGLVDQIGGEKGLPFGYKRIETFLKQEKTLKESFDMTYKTFEEHKGEEEQRDDLTLLAFQR